MNDMKSKWDLAEFLSHRQMPTATVVVYLNEYASHAKVQLQKALARATVEEAEELDRKLAAVEEALQKSRYEIHLEAIPAEMREDIHEKVLKDFPEKFNLLRQPAEDDPTRERVEAETLLLWEACIRKMITPDGREFDNPSAEDIRLLDRGLTSTAKVAIDQSIRELHEAAEQFTVEIKDPDF